ncbi:MAG: YccF domain-containing protein [Erysipelotrichaceae bacterium]|nr:YccF domain-containing protein [Erysipelotrichaceae bacterium]
MNFLMNILWFFVCGLWQWICWGAAGVIWCITVVGIPIGLQCFKIAGLVLCPFGKDVQYTSGGAVSFLMNILWFFISGLWLALAAVANGIALCITIVGIPFGLQCFKFAKLALRPFGAQVVSK